MVLFLTVFRRESVWKVSMSVRLRPEVRCTFDEDQSILRVVHKEAVGVEISEISSEQVVVYALTVRLHFADLETPHSTPSPHDQRGKVAKAEFTEFARSIISSTRLSDNSFSTPSTE